MPKRDSRIDSYIAEAAPFARPILMHFRELVHRANAEIEEALKWSMPFFVYRGANVCHMAAFKAHCAVGFWRKEVQREIEKSHAPDENAMGSLGRLTKRADLPPARELIAYIKQSCELIAAGVPRVAPGTKKSRPPLPVPADLQKALRQDAKARSTFEAFAPSHRRDYIEWITEAKRPETRATRLRTTLEWLREGKTRHWKYQR